MKGIKASPANRERPKKKKHKDFGLLAFLLLLLELRDQPAAAAARWRRGVSVGAVSLRGRFFGFLDLVCSSLPANSIIE